MEKRASANWNSRKMVSRSSELGESSYEKVFVSFANARLFVPRLCLLCLVVVKGQEYAQVVKMLGNGRCECFCFDGVTRLGHIRGKMRKKVWITAGDIVLVGKRDFQDEKVDIVHKYSADEARNLKQYGELPETARINETAVDMAMAGDDDDDDIGIDFDDI